MRRKSIIISWKLNFASGCIWYFLCMHIGWPIFIFLLEGAGKGPFGVDGKLESVDGDGRRLLGGHHQRQSRHGRHQAEEPESHVRHIGLQEKLTVPGGGDRHERPAHCGGIGRHLSLRHLYRRLSRQFPTLGHFPLSLFLPLREWRWQEAFKEKGEEKRKQALRQRVRSVSCK